MNMLGGDPLLSGQIDLAVVLIVILKVVCVFAFLLVATMLMIWFERKVVSDFQNRVGPNTAGPFGILQTLADGIKFFFKEDLIPDRAERRVFILAPLLTVVPACSCQLRRSSVSPARSWSCQGVGVGLAP